MIVIRDTTGITVKRTIQDVEHVRVGVLGDVRLWAGNGRGGAVCRHIEVEKKPHDAYTLKELSDFLLTLEKLPR